MKNIIDEKYSAPGVGNLNAKQRAHLDMKRLHPEVSASTSLNPLFPASLLLRREPEEEEDEDEDERSNSEEDDDQDQGYSK